jgi:hypothetical protein
MSSPSDGCHELWNFSSFYATDVDDRDYRYDQIRCALLCRDSSYSLYYCRQLRAHASFSFLVSRHSTHRQLYCHGNAQACALVFCMQTSWRPKPDSPSTVYCNATAIKIVSSCCFAKSRDSWIGTAAKRCWILPGMHCRRRMSFSCVFLSLQILAITSFGLTQVLLQLS